MTGWTAMDISMWTSERVLVTSLQIREIRISIQPRQRVSRYTGWIRIYPTHVGCGTYIQDSSVGITGSELS